MNEGRINAEQEELELDLGKLLQHYARHWKLVLVSGVIAALVAFLFTVLFFKPKYKASTMIYVNSSAGQQQVTEVNGQTLATSQRLVNTYVNIIKSDTVLNDVIEQGKLDYTASMIRSMMTVGQVANTEMFTVSISNEDPAMAAHIANTIADAAPHSIAAFIEGSSTKIVDYAVEPKRPYTPDKKKNTILGGTLGCLLMLGMLTLQYLFDMRLKDEEDINSYFTAPVLGSIPEIENDAGKAGEDE